jgi:hypothetical protein
MILGLLPRLYITYCLSFGNLVYFVVISIWPFYITTGMSFNLITIITAIWTKTVLYYLREVRIFNVQIYYWDR